MAVGVLLRCAVIGTVMAWASCANISDQPDRSPDTEPTRETRSIDDVASDVKNKVKAYGPVTTGQIVLVRVGDQIEVVTSGRSDKARRTPMAADQTFPIASITKPMTAVVVLQLVAEGRLALDEPVQPWLPELAAVRAPITVEQLLSHRGGLPDATNADIMRLGFGTEPHLREAAADGVDFRPGTDGSYDNLGYAALGLLVERVLDRPLAAVFQDRIFEPIGMTTASLGGDPEVVGYVGNRDSTPMLGLDLFPAAGSVVASAGDVDAFFQSLWAGDLIDLDSLAQMRRGRGPVGFWWDDYGVGLAQAHFPCGDAYGHGGRIAGFTNEAWTLEGEERSVVVMVNDDLNDSVAINLVQEALCD